MVRIDDAMPEASVAVPVAKTSLPTEVPAPVVAEVIEALPAYKPVAINFKPNKEKQSVAKPNKLLRLFMGKHLIEMARATDADPEKIMDAAEALQEEEEPTVDKKARDGELPAALKEHQFKADDKKAKDGEEEMSEDRKAAHDALDAILDRTKGTETGVPAKDRRKTKDADIEALKTLLDEFLSEEEEEDEHAADDAEADPAELEAVLAGEAEDAEEACPDCGEAHDAEEECPGEEEVGSGEEAGAEDDEDDDDQEDVEDRRKAGDRARASDAAMATLRMLRPFAARSSDKGFQKAFNRALDSVKKSSRASAGSYGAFAGSARARDKAPRDPAPDRARTGDAGADPITKMQDFYNNAHKGGK
jgi:hypothetical protein